MIVTSKKKQNYNFKLLATLPNNAKADKRVSVTVSSHQIRPERKLEKRNISQTSTAQRYNLVNSTKKDSFIRNSAHAHWQTVCVYARSIQCANSFSMLQQFKCVENFHFSTIDYFSVKLAPVVKLVQYYLCEKGSRFFVRHVSDIWYSQSLQPVCGGSQAVEHSERYYPQFKHSSL